MSIPRRSYDLLRGYINREWDRISGIQDPVYSSAHAELEDALQNPVRSTRTSAGASPTPPTQPSEPSAAPEPFDPKVKARVVLGVDPDADFATVQAAFTRLNRRSDPSNFPPNSSEAYQAVQIQRRVQEAFQILQEGMDATELRFRSLELD